jgi:hypothetical protein
VVLYLLVQQSLLKNQIGLFLSSQKEVSTEPTKEVITKELNSKIKLENETASPNSLLHFLSVKETLRNRPNTDLVYFIS